LPGSSALCNQAIHDYTIRAAGANVRLAAQQKTDGQWLMVDGQWLMVEKA